MAASLSQIVSRDTIGVKVIDLKSKLEQNKQSFAKQTSEKARRIQVFIHTLISTKQQTSPLFGGGLYYTKQYVNIGWN